jgi:hypothetical protein
MDVKNIVERLGAEEAVRKMAAFQLQNNILVPPTTCPPFSSSASAPFSQS